MTARQLVERLGLTVLALSSTVVLPARQAAAIPDSLFEGLSWRPIGPMRGGPDVRGRRPSEPPVHVLHGRVQRRRVEDDRCRHHLDFPSSTISRRSRSVRWRSRRRTRTSFMSAAARGCTVPTCRSATASTNPTDAGRDVDASRASRRAADPEIAVDPRNPDRLFVAVLGHPYGPNPRARDLPVDGRRADVHTGAHPRREHRGATTWTSTRRIRTSSTRRSGRIARVRGRTRRGAAPAAASSNRPTAATTWRPLTNGLPQDCSMPRSPSRRAIRSACTRSWRPPAAVGAAPRRAGRRRLLPIGRRGRDVDETDDRQPRGQPARARIAMSSSIRRIRTTSS